MAVTSENKSSRYQPPITSGSQNYKTKLSDTMKELENSQNNLKKHLSTSPEEHKKSKESLVALKE